MENFAYILFILAGMFSVFASVKNYDWFFNKRRGLACRKNRYKSFLCVYRHIHDGHRYCMPDKKLDFMRVKTLDIYKILPEVNIKWQLKSDSEEWVLRKLLSIV